MALRIVLLGGPGAGKGTQAKRLCEAHKLAHVASGDILREQVAQGTELGLRIKAALDNGQLVSDELACEVVFERLRQPDANEGFVLDGFPRSLAQAQSLNGWLEGQNEQLDAVLMLEVTDEEIVERILARRQCPDCGAIYNLRFNGNLNGDRCPTPGCTGKLEQRTDDKEETVRKRLRVYHDSTRPLLDYYEQKGLLKRVPGDSLAPEDVYRKIEETLAAMGVV